MRVYTDLYSKQGGVRGGEAGREGRVLDIIIPSRDNVCGEPGVTGQGDCSSAARLPTLIYGVVRRVLVWPIPAGSVSVRSIDILNYESYENRRSEKRGRSELRRAQESNDDRNVDESSDS